MIKNKVNHKEIIVLKYIFMIVIFYLLVINKNVALVQVTVFLLYIANNQIRNFILKENTIRLVLSILIEYILSIVLLNFIGEYSILIFIPTLIDVATKINIVSSTIYFVLIIIGNLILGNKVDVINIVITTLPIILFGAIITKESSGKVKAQNLYDKLRVNEEELKKANVELENYANTIEEISILRERNRISREIHDNVGHALSTINIQLGAIEKVAPKDGIMAASMANNLASFTKESLERVRTAVRKMKPREFEEFEGIIAISEMIKNFEKLSAIKVKLRVSENVWKINTDQTMVIYRIVQEFLSNSVRHGKATEVKVFINFLEDSLRIQLKDNGIGCTDVNEGIGLNSIRERVSIWGGNIEYYTKENEGFEVIVTMDRGKLSIDEI